MMNNKKIIRHLSILLALFYVGFATAAPRVSVTIPPLHSLVTALMKEVAEPTLLLPPGASNTEMDPFQKSQMLTSDLIIWMGSGLETPVAKTLQAMPSLDQKMITLANYVPLFKHHNRTDLSLSRQQAYDLEFWSDPRLAIMAVRMITPRLVRLDPDHQELYLDNEIALIRSLKQMQNDLAAKMKPFDGISHNSMAGLDRYFRHRFLPMSEMAIDLGGDFLKVSTETSVSCMNAKYEIAKLAPGASFYFEAMQLKALSFSSCLEKQRGIKTAAEQGSDSGKET